MADLFSDAFVGLEGLEIDELKELTSAVQDLIRKHDHVLQRTGARKKRAVKAKEDSLDTLKACIDGWLARPPVTPKANEGVIARSGRALLEDRTARKSLRQLYVHLLARRNPIATADQKGWNDQLDAMVQELCENLAETAFGDNSKAPLWIPKERSQPLKDEEKIALPQFTEPQEPWEIEPEPEPDATHKENNTSRRLQKEWLYYQSTADTTPASIVSDILNGKRTPADPQALRMPLYVPPSYASQMEPMDRLQTPAPPKNKAAPIDEDDDEDGEGDEDDDEGVEDGEDRESIASYTFSSRVSSVTGSSNSNASERPSSDVDVNNQSTNDNFQPDDDA
ncbi:uncharacterized protein N0V89_010098 [Didymosphaeria variabile]|uniref:Uncharacterized protein n=1 Tax=Didymosphaeria variabile TaxID=1932322 RepID=A0A9W9C8A0_9PLEO|nr:uncharacterized protein N0V89_010098 [Didymosphaeria variabile]KAJ4348720.1 hypothetical protein N0V89_010098 [Didymosphaeria variabile]